MQAADDGTGGEGHAGDERSGDQGEAAVHAGRLHECHRTSPRSHPAARRHFNPVKHGWAQRAADWPHSSFQCFIRDGVIDASCASVRDSDINAGE
jgi:hypothetical protein